MAMTILFRICCLAALNHVCIMLKALLEFSDEISNLVPLDNDFYKAFSWRGAYKIEILPSEYYRKCNYR